MNDECGDTDWDIRPRVVGNGIIRVNKDNSTGLAITNLSDSEYFVGAHEVVLSLLNTRRAYANLQRRNYEDDTVSTKSESAILKVTTGCSGLDVPLYALKALGRKVQHLSSSGNDKVVRETIRANHQPEKLYDDIRHRELSSEVQSDLYVAGFSCQPFSNAGLKKGFSDEKNGGIFQDVLEFINKCTPKAFLLENVECIRHHAKGKTFETIINSLEGSGLTCDTRSSTLQIREPHKTAKECTYVK